MDLKTYGERKRVTKEAAEAYVTKYGQQTAHLHGANTSELLALFSQSVVAQSLFIGYLVSGCLAHDVDWYISSWWAQFGISVRAVVVVLGVSSLILEAAISSQTHAIRAMPGYSKLDGITFRQEDQAAWVFLHRAELLRVITAACGTLVFVTFVLGFLLDVYTKFRDQLDLTGSFTTILVICILLLLLCLWVRNEGSKALAAMGYEAGGCGCCLLKRQGPASHYTYTTGLPLQGSGSGIHRGGSYL